MYMYSVHLLFVHVSCMYTLPIVSPKSIRHRTLLQQYKPQQDIPHTIRDVTRPTKQPGYLAQLRCNPYLYQGATITYFVHISGFSYNRVYKELGRRTAKIRTRLDRLFVLIRCHLDGDAAGWSSYCRSMDDVPDF